MTPILIITLCRYEHLVNCIESLQKNALAKETELYIGLDYPSKESHWPGYRKIEEYLEKGIDGFKCVHVMKHTHNLGPTENYRAVRSAIFEKFDGYIYTEDDNVFSPNYLEYMNICMEKYRDDREVLAVSGYMYPIEIPDSGANVIRISTYCSAFGYGIFKREDDVLDKNINLETFLRMYRDKKMMKKLRKASPNQYCNFVKGMVEYTPDIMKEGKVRSVDLTWGLYAFFNGYKIVFPTISKVRNNGYDGSGVNCLAQSDVKVNGTCYRDYDFAGQRIDEEKHFHLCCTCDQGETEVNRALSDFFKIPRRELLMTELTYRFSLIIGVKRMTKLIRILRRGNCS